MTKYVAYIFDGQQVVKRVSLTDEKAAREYMESMAIVMIVDDYKFVPMVKNELTNSSGRFYIKLLPELH